MKSSVVLHPETLTHKIGFDPIMDAALRQTFTVYGKEELNSSFPVSDPKLLEEMLGLVNEWILVLQGESNQPLTTVEDIRPVLKESRIEGALLPLDYFLIVYQNARLARLIRNYFKKEDQSYPRLKKLIAPVVEMKQLEEEILRVVTEQGTLRDDASPELKSIRSRLNRRRTQLRKTINSLMKSAREKGMTSDEGATIRNGRMVIPIQVEYKRKVDGFVHDVSSSGQTVYIEPVAALQVNNDIRQLEAEEKREIERIIRELTTVVRQYREPLRKNSEVIGKLDSLHARVKTGLQLDGSIPRWSEKGSLNMANAKNPNLLLKNLTADKPEKIVPLNLELEENERGLIITGPNAGGKSVAMKTAGLVCLMLQYGFPVPVDEHSTLPLLSGLFIDVGDDQSIESDLSTFSSRLKWMHETLQKATSGSLVLIDEAGTGTDPEEGGALFQAFIEHLIERNIQVIATTHHGSLKVFAHEHPQVVNGAMEFDQKNLSPTYRFRKGVPGSSYAFEIADRMNVQEVVMDRARELLGEQRDKMGSLLLTLEKQVQQAEETERELKKKEKSAEELEQKLRNKTEDFDKKRKKKMEEAYAEADRIMETANQRIEEAVEKIAAAGNENRDLVKEARREIEHTKKVIREKKSDLEIKRPGKPSEPPKVGDYVTVGESGTAGEVVEVSGKQVKILVNGMKIKSKLKDIQKAEKPEPAKKSTTRTYKGSDNIDLSVKPKLDIRGFRGDDAIKELEGYLDRASARGLNRVEIIHGKGEGILKKLVHEYLETRNEITRFSIAPIEHGGAGCTIVELG